MKKLCAIFAIVLCLLTAFACAEPDYAPESGTGWMKVDIYDEPQELSFKGISKGMSGEVFIFENETYTVSIVLDKKLEVGVTGGENSIKQIEVYSHATNTSGYYFTKKSSSASVDSEVTLQKKAEDGVWQGNFRVTVLTADRWLGDMKPGLIAELPLENGEFCFCE